MKLRLLWIPVLVLLVVSCKKAVNEKALYYPNGKLWKKYVYLNPRDTNSYHFYEFFENGVIKRLYDVTDGLEDGKSFTYYENGSLQSVFYYTRGKLNSAARNYDAFGRLSDKGLFVNNVLIEKEEFFYGKDVVRVNAFSKKNGKDMEEAGKLLYDNKHRFGFDNSFYYVTSSRDSVKLSDSLKIQVNFIGHCPKGSHLSLYLGQLNERAEFAGVSKEYSCDSLMMQFNFKPEKAGYNIVMGKLKLIPGDRKGKENEFVFYHDFLAY
jgi:hypothetical protein